MTASTGAAVETALLVARADTILGGDGNDTLEGNNDADHIEGGLGHDAIYGGNGNDTLDGGEGHDSISGGQGVDLIYGRDGNDTISAGGSSTVYAGDGDDLLWRDPTMDRTGVVYMEGGNDTVEEANGSETVYLGDGNDRYVGSSGRISPFDTVYGEAGDDHIEMYANWELDVHGDLYNINAGFADGGAGIDTLFLVLGDVNTYNLDFRNLTVPRTVANYTFQNFENIWMLGGGSDTVFFGGGDDAYLGESSATIDCGAGNDTVSCASGTAWGGSGNDWLFFLWGGELHGGIGNDTLQAGGASIFDGGDGDDVILGGAPDAQHLGGAGNDFIRISLFSVGGDDTAGVGTAFVDGGAGFDTVELDFHWRNPRDLDFGGIGTGASYLIPGRADLHNVEAVRVIGSDGTERTETIIGSSGNDTILSGGGVDILRGGLGADELHGGAENDNIVGNEGNDAIYGGAGDDYGHGGQGNDTLVGEDGNDRLDGGAGADIIDGGAGGDVLIANQGNDSLIGGADGDYMHGGQGNDTVRGGDGNDVMLGGVGSDNIDGGVGWDGAAWSGLRADYSITNNGSANWTVVHTATGDTDTVTSVEFLVFDDQIVS